MTTTVTSQGSDRGVLSCLFSIIQIWIILGFITDELLDLGHPSIRYNPKESELILGMGTAYL